ncbi:unnamed protein product, partial [Citrullus colocynthis]
GGHSLPDGLYPCRHRSIRLRRCCSVFIRRRFVDCWYLFAFIGSPHLEICHRVSSAAIVQFRRTTLPTSSLGCSPQSNSARSTVQSRPLPPPSEGRCCRLISSW